MPFLFLVTEQQLNLTVKIGHNFTVLNDTKLIIFSKSLLDGLFVCNPAGIGKYRAVVKVHILL